MNNFCPDLTPLQMLKLGVFGGAYFGGVCPKEFPKSWDCLSVVYSQVFDKNLNCFKVASGQSAETWRKSNWIVPQDPLGWFQWYCRFYLKRVSQDDLRQKKRWAAFCRHKAQVVKHGSGDPEKRKIQRQALLQWGYDPFPDIPNNNKETVYQKVQRIMK